MDKPQIVSSKPVVKVYHRFCLLFHFIPFFQYPMQRRSVFSEPLRGKGRLYCKNEEAQVHLLHRNRIPTRGNVFLMTSAQAGVPPILMTHLE